MKPWVLHETDLFRPHQDPDDHWDLACQFALARRGLIDLRGVLIDYPPHPERQDPDITAIAQLGWITGIPVPAGMGQIHADEAPGSGLMLLKRTLEESPEPIALHIVGSCRDIAQCGLRWPELFRKKVKALYLNAGSGTNTEHLEYNVNLDIEHYTQIFTLPCPIYWMPCFHNVEDMTYMGGYGTFYSFEQRRIFDEMPPAVLNYFLGMLTEDRGCDWFAALNRPVDVQAKEHFSRQERWMWCTGGFLNTAGLTVWKDGTIAPLGQSPQREVFSFVPINITCTADGRTHWAPSSDSIDRFIYHVEDEAAYPEAMTLALKQLISWLWQDPQ